jgi:hypothetical protein
MSSPHVPIELVYAAGLRALIVRGGSMPTPLADAQLEPGVFPNRIRQLVELALDGRLGEAAAIVLPRTSEADYKAFLYLREFVRQGTLRHRERVLLMDLLQSGGNHVATHNAAVARALFAALTSIVGTPVRAGWEHELRTAIVRVNTARAAVRRLLALRRGWPRITGAEVLPLLGAFWDLPPESATARVSAAADEIAARAPLVRPRVLHQGAPVDTPALHTAIEAHGMVVVAETGPFGSDVAGADVDAEAEPFAAIVDRYGRESWGPRTPIHQVRRSITERLDGVDAVVVSLPPDDGVFGWDYPWLREQLEALDVPHVRLRCDPYAPIPDRDRERLAAMAANAMPREESRRG